MVKEKWEGVVDPRKQARLRTFHRHSFPIVPRRDKLNRYREFGIISSFVLHLYTMQSDSICTTSRSPV